MSQWLAWEMLGREGGKELGTKRVEEASQLG